MPSYAIHIAIAKEMIRKNKNKIENKDEFILGTIKPDLEKEKNIFHEGLLEEYVRKGVKSDYDKGYVLHLIADESFYFDDFRKEYFKGEEIDKNNHNNFYQDFNKLVPILVKKYNINSYPKEIEKNMQGEEGILEHINLEKLFKFIDKISDLIIDDVITELKSKL